MVLRNDTDIASSPPSFEQTSGTVPGFHTTVVSRRPQRRLVKLQKLDAHFRVLARTEKREERHSRHPRKKALARHLRECGWRQLYAPPEDEGGTRRDTRKMLRADA